jgi:RNA polymerase sigma factor (sigma-70 family)
MDDRSALHADPWLTAPALSGGMVSESLTETYREHYVALVRLARQLVDDRETAEEAVQDVFVRLQKRFPKDGVTYPYLRASVVNQCRSKLRQRRLFRRYALAADHGAFDDPAAGIADRQRMRDAIAQLPRRQREVVVLRYFEDLSMRTVADALGINVNAASAALHRALRSLSHSVGSDDER